MIREAIILAGGLGTRLREEVPDLPKCMAPVAGRPFLHYVIQHLRAQGIQRFIFSLGYRHETIESFLENEWKAGDGKYLCAVEETPLGTGGAVLGALKLAKDDAVLIVNGDTFFSIDIEPLSDCLTEKNADCVLALKLMDHFDRYGVVDIAEDGRITSFREKQFYESGLINGGVYALKVSNFLQNALPEKFSFEKDYLEAFCGSKLFFGNVHHDYFIDIGIPEDFRKANADFNQFPPK